MATYNVPSGTFTYSNTLAVSVADTVTFADRAGDVSVTNTGTTVMYARADGQTAVVAGAGCIPVVPNATVVLANGEPLWYPSSKVIPAGTVQYPTGGGTTTTTPNGQPGEVQPYMSSLAGQKANPGTVVSLISTGADSYTVALAG